MSRVLVGFRVFLSFAMYGIRRITTVRCVRRIATNVAAPKVTNVPDSATFLDVTDYDVKVTLVKYHVIASQTECVVPIPFPLCVETLPVPCECVFGSPCGFRTE